jgi:predicted DNA-binding transcriptional regulator AlpA
MTTAAATALPASSGFVPHIVGNRDVQPSGRADSTPCLPLPVRRFLSIQEAAAYVGVSVSTFKLEVASGMWPQPVRRGAAGRSLTWDVRALDVAADRLSGCAPSVAPAASDGPKAAEAAAMERFRGAAKKHPA